jgi:sulfur-carrier protein adenylyltransferase/sulfurtransferase
LLTKHIIQYVIEFNDPIDMNEPNNQPSSEILSQKEIRRYTAQINNSLIGLVGQEKIKSAKVLVIGAGAKGVSILQNLLAIGVGKLGIIDNSFIEESDLGRQFLYGNNDLGKHKAIVAKQKLQEINHLINLDVHNVFISEKNAEILCQNYDLVIDATDNLQAHYLISDIAVKFNKPLIYTSITESSVQISVFNYKNGPSFRSLVTEGTQILNSGDVNSSLCLAPILSMIGAIAANETIKVILDLDTQLRSNLLSFNLINYSFILLPIIPD